MWEAVAPPLNPSWCLQPHVPPPRALVHVEARAACPAGSAATAAPGSAAPAHRPSHSASVQWPRSGRGANGRTPRERTHRRRHGCCVRAPATRGHDRLLHPDLARPSLRCARCRSPGARATRARALGGRAPIHHRRETGTLERRLCRSAAAPTMYTKPTRTDTYQRAAKIRRQPCLARRRARGGLAGAPPQSPSCPALSDSRTA